MCIEAEADGIPHIRFLCVGTCIVLHQLLYSVKLRPRGDVVATVVQLADFIMLDVVPFVVVPVTDGQRVSTWEKRVTWSRWYRQVSFYTYRCPNLGNFLILRDPNIFLEPLNPQLDTNVATV